MDVIEKAQEIYTIGMGAAANASSEAVAHGYLKREEVFASESLTAVKAWAEATKRAVKESASVTKAKEIGGGALTMANESYAAAWSLAEEKRLEAVKLSSIYLTAAQEQLSSLVETDQGKKLQERTKKLFEL